MRWIEKYLTLPAGAGAGAPLRVAKFQRELVALLYDGLATFASVPAANGKTTFLAAVALERICRGDDYAAVAVVATKEDQAGILVEQAKRMVECCPQLVPLCSWHGGEGSLEYRPTGSKLTAHPAKLTSLQGLDFSLAIVDEVGFANDEHVESLIARVGKRPGARIVGIGTPGFERNVLARIRDDARDGAFPHGVRYIEWAAPAGCELSDKRAWRKANPALGAGFLQADALEMQVGILPERAFRTYHLGQWVEVAPSGWLPEGAWAACPLAPPPPDGSEIVLGIEGTYRRTLAVVGCGLDGTVFFAYAADSAPDEQLRRLLAAYMDRFEVREIVHNRRIRVALFRELAADGMPLTPWAASSDVEAASANDFYREIVEGRIAHDHDALVDEHMRRARGALARGRLVALVALRGRGRVLGGAGGKDGMVAARRSWPSNGGRSPRA